MTDSPLRSLYVVQTQVVGLDRQPFPKAHLLRPAWRGIFCNRRCFADQRQLIRDASSSFKDVWRTELELRKGKGADKDDNDLEDRRLHFILPLPSLPFIRGLGSICFNTRRIHTSTSYRRSDLAFELWNQENEDYLQQDTNDQDDESSWLLGYDSNIQDQRMNYLCFELARPLSLHAKTHNDIQANGKLFIHIYPSGYFVFHLAVSLVWEEARSLSMVREILRELRPHHLNPTWTWSSRLGKENESLHLLIHKIYKLIEVSLFSGPDSKLRKGGQWCTFLRVTTEKSDPNQVSSTLLGSHSMPKVIGDLSPPSCRSGAECLVITRQGAACIFRPFSIQHEDLRKNYPARLSALIDKVRDHLATIALSAEIRDDIQRTVLNSELFCLKDRPHAHITQRLRRNVNNINHILYELRNKEISDSIDEAKQERWRHLNELTEQIEELKYLVREMHVSWAKPQAARRFFWKMSRIQEFVLVKERIYEDYERFIQNRIHELQKFRRSLKRKILEEDLFKFSVFDQQVADYLIVLDRHIKQTNNFYRYVYSFLCQGTRIDDHRRNVLELINEWDKEAETWDYPVCAVWKRILKPFLAVFK